MQGERRADIWDEVWAEYDERQAARYPARPTPRRRRRPVRPEPFSWAPAPEGFGVPAFEVPGVAAAVAFGASTAENRAPRRRVRPMVQVTAGLVAGLLLLALWLALPWMLAMRLSVPIGQGDGPGLLRQFDTPAAMASLRAGLAAEIPEGSGEGARRFLGGMADRMAASWQKPEAVASWLAMRARGGRFEGSPVPLSGLRSARPTGLTSFRLEYGPSVGEGGVAFDVAWQGDGFRVTGVNFLGAPSAPFIAGGPMLALR
jgi:hypothetical protein